MCLLLFVIIPCEYCFFFSGSFSVKGFEACKYCYSSRHCSHTKVSHTGIWISGKCRLHVYHCLLSLSCYMYRCNIIKCYWSWYCLLGIPSSCLLILMFLCCLFVCFFRKKTSSNIWMTVAELWAWTMSEWVQTKFMSLIFFFCTSKGITDFYKVIYLFIYLFHFHFLQLFLFQLLRGLHYCHSRKVLHRWALMLTLVLLFNVYNFMYSVCHPLALH